MNDNLHTYIEPELEARITALVLGEASEFEVDALERMIQENPELQIFRRRLKVIHELLGDTVKPQHDERWQLSEQRRMELKKTFSKNGKPIPGQPAKSQDRTSIWKKQIHASVAIAACLMLCFILFMMATPVVMKSEKSAFEPQIVSYSASEERDARISKREMSRSVERKPSSPGSSMSKVVASRANSPTSVPAPSVDMPDPMPDFGNGDDFGDGWGGVGGGVVDGSDIVWSSEKGNRDAVVRRELIQPPTFRVDSKSDAFKALNPDEGIGNTATAGLRSGDFATTRNSIDAILNNPDEGDEVRSSTDSDDTSSRGKKSRTKWSAGISMGFDDELEDLQKDGAKPSIDAYAGEALSSIAQKEITRRSALVGDADKALIAGREAYTRGEFEKASELYRKGAKLLPPGPSLADRRRSIAGHLSDADVALAQKYRRTGKVTEARDLLESTLAKDPTNYAAKKQLEYLDDPIRSNAALTYEHTQNVDRVRKDLYIGEGLYNLGKYDEADKHFKKVLQTDKHNKAARRWLEKVAATKSDYYRAAYDHTRAELLKEVDKAWEMSVPSEENERQVAKPVPPVSKNAKGKDGKLTALGVELKNKDARVAELRKRLMDVSEKVGLVYVETEDGGKTIGNITALRDAAEKELYEAQGKKRQLEFQLNKLLAVNDDDLISVASELPDVGFREAYNKFEDAKTELKTMKASGLSEKHPDFAMRKTRIEELEKNLNRRAVNVRKSLKHSLALVKGQVENMKKVINEQQDQGLDKARSMQELNVARKEYEMARAIRDGIKAKYDFEKTKAGELPTAAPGAPIPSPVPPKALPDETMTAATPFSTFSLNVSNVSFKLAKVALLEKGEWPDAAKVRTEEFINAFDYGDPSPRRGESVACAVDQSAHPFLQQRNLLRVGMKTAAIGRSAPLRLTILLDNSGSMEREDREESVLAAIRVLAAQLGPKDVITMVGFARQPRLLADRISGDKADQLVDIVANTPSEGGTNIEEALRLARTLAKRQHTEGAQDRVVLITDGVANLGNTIPEDLSQQIVAMRQEGIAFDACGVGAEGLNDDILEALTRKGDGRYYFLNRAEDADSGFAKQLAGALTPAAKNVKVQVKFNPKRVTRYRLLGFEKHRLKKEDFRNDKVDAAEMAAEEAGNAVYQIQVNPQGVGELGQVFVRFLDVSTGRMVERSWPLPYEPQAPSFDQAVPSMQLAGTAAMLGEKLHGTDAGSVRFSMITNTLNRLRGHFAADSKVQDLIRMCRKVK